MSIRWLLLPLSFAVVVAVGTFAADHEKLSPSAASSLAAELANHDCQRRFSVSPFQASAATPRLVDGRWHWRAVVGYGRGDLLAEVSFTEFGENRAVQVNLLDNRR